MRDEGVPRGRGRPPYILRQGAHAKWPNFKGWALLAGTASKNP